MLNFQSLESTHKDCCQMERILAFLYKKNSVIFLEYSLIEALYYQFPYISMLQYYLK